MNLILLKLRLNMYFFFLKSFVSQILENFKISFFLNFILI